MSDEFMSLEDVFKGSGAEQKKKKTLTPVVEMSKPGKDFSPNRTRVELARSRELVKARENEILSLKGKLEDAGQKGEEGAAGYVSAMPKSGEEVSFELYEVSPEDVFISPQNERLQTLLDEGSVSDILESIKEHGQQKPGMLREAGGRFELIEGSRRLFCCRLLKIPFVAFVGDVPDEDVRALSRIENKHRAISIYERALSIKRDVENGFYQNWALAAKGEGISVSSARRYEKLASLPEMILKAYPSPTDVSARAADWLTLKWKSDKARGKPKSAAKEIAAGKKKLLKDGAPLLSAEQIMKQFKDGVKEGSKKPTQKKPVVFKTKSGVQKVRHTVSSSGSHKLELLDVSKTELEKILSYVRSAVKAV